MEMNLEEVDKRSFENVQKIIQDD
ncbi:hypothetical protein CCACVL1_05068 [Corchorus capsularis]|uniref:Uncharacterized protein n=1 Tax=Corchorus capsularis TaxID=210143 RepID=A0A1R3JML9_COCAP|nr:hypothetical protein CCACVL1_05068 [Corchorus capsularis]